MIFEQKIPKLSIVVPIRSNFLNSTLQKPQNVASPRNPFTVLSRSMGRSLITPVYLDTFDEEIQAEHALGPDGGLFLYPNVSVNTFLFNVYF